MIIINQDNTRIINFDNVTQISIYLDDEEDGFLIGADTNSAESSCWDLGRYHSKERAKQVLFEITDAYRSICDDTYFIVYKMPIE